MRLPPAPTLTTLAALAALVALTALAPSVVLTAPAAEEKFPYKAAVTVPDAVLRAGPGDNFYVTEKLQPGMALEVYHRDRDGWLAVRPLPGSFSWVSSRHLKIGADGLAEVLDERVASRVGSSLGDMRDVVQVRLHRGEIVELVDPRATDAGPTPWHKIVAPAGEFRWIHERLLDRAAAPPTNAEAAGASPAAPEPAPTAVAAPSSAAPGAVALPSGAVATVSPEQFRAELDDINAQLSLVLAQPPGQWQCDTLAQRVQKLLSQTQDAAQRSEARAVAGRIAQAEDVRRRYETPAGRSGARLLAGRPGNNAGGTRSPDSRYDGMGRLVRVEPGSVGGPRYALVDDGGRVLHYVAPSAGVNMNYYVGRRVGVVGTRSPLADQDSELVTARHVSPLEGRLR